MHAWCWCDPSAQQGEDLWDQDDSIKCCLGLWREIYDYREGKFTSHRISKVSVKCVQQLFGFSSSPSSSFANITFLSILTRHCCSRSTVSAKSGQWVEESSSCMSPHSITTMKMIIKALMIMKIVLWPFLILRANHLRPRQSRCRWCP